MNHTAKGIEFSTVPDDGKVDVVRALIVIYLWLIRRFLYGYIIYVLSASVPFFVSTTFLRYHLFPLASNMRRERLRTSRIIGCLFRHRKLGTHNRRVSVIESHRRPLSMVARYVPCVLDFTVAAAVLAVTVAESSRKKPRATGSCQSLYQASSQ
jgi:hypothetical protein